MRDERWFVAAHESIITVTPIPVVNSCTDLFLSERREVVRSGPGIHFGREVVDDGADVDESVGESHGRLLPLTLVGCVPQGCEQKQDTLRT